MLFGTYTYAIFLIVVFPAYLALPLRGRQIMLLIASYVFYCWEKPIYGILMFLSTILDYLVGLGFGKAESIRWRRVLLGCSLAGNLGMLGFFKYGDFLAGNICGLGALLGFPAHWEPMRIILPVGISFYTFQTLSYSIDLYWRRIPVERDFTTFALFVSFFPQLVAGPIERASHLLPQLKIFHQVTRADIIEGLKRIAIGLFLKKVVADRLSILVDAVYASPESFPAFTIWLGLIAFGGQIYFDFGSYAHIAIGSARMFGVRIMENFNRPLLADSIADFWNRWHMSLTGWFRDYVFNPLGGFRKGGARAALNASIVLLLCGLWHGAAWHFVAWGAYHAVLLSLYYTWKFTMRNWLGKEATRKSKSFTILLLSVLLTFLSTTFSGIFFRSPDMVAVMQMCRAAFSLHTTFPNPVEWYVWGFALIILVWLVIEFCQEYLDLNARYRRLPWTVRAIGWALLVVATILGAVNHQAPYIYFQF